MSTNWIDHYVRCYYFKGADSKSQIRCQGVADGSVLQWKFGCKDDYLIQIKVFCCDKYENCEVYQMLKKIYESEE